MNQLNRKVQYIFEGTRKMFVERMYTVSPKEAERYFMRMLLPHVMSAKSFQSLKTVLGELNKSYRDSR